MSEDAGRLKTLPLPEGIKPLESAQIILSVLVEDFDAELVSLEITESATRMEVASPSQRSDETTWTMPPKALNCICANSKQPASP